MLGKEKAFSSFSTDDIDKAQDFYQNTLALKITKDEMGILWLDLNGADVIIYPKEETHQPASFTVLNFNVDNLEETVKKLKEKGVEFEHYDRPKTDDDNISRSENGHKVAWFKDPAGNILSVMTSIE
ncbi:MAG: glyoxalase [Cytophagaceae bacterium]|nr:glyoxalase [Cytophagaceae bacterium]|tara:strand:+ start:1112 stop:1492 length:381 start_codon:yes stop_codon:yes gene_type:complete